MSADPLEPQGLPDEPALYPTGDSAKSQIVRRQRSATAWRFGFLAATALAVVILSVLILSIVNQSTGLVAIQSSIPESQLVTDFNTSRIENAPNVILASEDDSELAEGIAADPNGVGFMGHGAYQQNSDGLKLLTIDGVAPTAETTQSGAYPLARELYLFTSDAALNDKPQVQAFLIYYLQHLQDALDATGYFPADAQSLADQEAGLKQLLGVDELPAINPADYQGDLVITGSSTVHPITLEVAKMFRREGFKGGIKLTSTGTAAGFEALCAGDADIANASRQISQVESEACLGDKILPRGLVIGSDAVTVVANAGNAFASDLTQPQLETLLTSALGWSDVDAEWPSDAVNRYIPTGESGTTDFVANTVFTAQALADMPYDALVGIFTANVTAGRCKAAEAEQRFYADRFVCDTEEAFQARCDSANPPTGCTLGPRDQASMLDLIQAEVIKPEVQQAWFLFESIFNRDAVVAEAQQKYPNAEVQFKRWLTLDFVTSPQSSTPETAGVRTAILGTLWVTVIGIGVGFPIGVGAAIYLEEYADKRRRINRIIQTNINNLAGVPSIIYGLLGLTVFVRVMEPITSGAIFGLSDPTTANGRTVLSGGLTLALLILPVIIITSQEAIKAVPPSLREASLGIGATKWQTVWNHVLPNAIGGILTGVILAMSRIIGETAPLVVVGASTYITTDPTGPFSKFTTLPTQIYQWTARPQQTFLLIAGAAIVVLLILLFILNAVAIYLRNRYARRLGG